MPLGREVGFSPKRDIVLDGDPDPLPKRGRSPPPIFGPCLLWPNSWMDQDGTWYFGTPRPRPDCVRRGPSPPSRKGYSSPLSSVHVYCGHGRPSQLLLSTCLFFLFTALPAD